MRPPRLERIYALYGAVLNAVRTFAAAESFTEILPSFEGVPGIHPAEREVVFTQRNGAKWTLPSCQTVPKQIAAGFLDHVYCIAPCYRDEGNTATHLKMFYQIEFESTDASLSSLVQLARRFVAHMLVGSETKKKKALAELPWMSVDLAGHQPPITGRASYDRLVAKLCGNSEAFVAILHPPAFLQPANKRYRELWAEGFELFMPHGHGELASGGIRNRGFTNARTVPWLRGSSTQVPRHSGGFGVGLERLTGMLSGCRDIRELMLPHMTTAGKASKKRLS